MADITINKSDAFEFTYSAKQREEVEKIRNKYLPKTESKMEQLIRLDKKAEQPGQITSLAVGIIGALILGTGMSLTMVLAEEIMLFVLGIVLGIIGMALCGIAYPLYVRITKKEREKIADQIIALSEALSL